MLYPVAPEKIESFKDKLNSASDAERLPRPSFKALEGNKDQVQEVVSRFIEGAEITDPVDGFHQMRYRGREFCLVEVEWPAPLRDLDGDRVLYTGNVPVGPDPMAMWQVLFILP